MMFEYLRIQNLALIDDMELEFSSGMNVITGETGAGKSFILKAINFLMGDKLRVDMVRQGKERAQIEALFVHPEKGELILRRELSAATGRSRFYLNDKLTSQDTIKELQPKLLTHTSQHGQQKLLQPLYQEKIIDAWVEQPELFKQKDILIEEIKTLLKNKEKLIYRCQEIEERRDLFESYLYDINKVKPIPNEDEQLELLKEEIRSIAMIQKKQLMILQILQGEEGSLINHLSLIEKNLECFLSIDQSIMDTLPAIIECRQQLNELTQKLRKLSLVTSEQNKNIEEIEARLFELSQLKRKLHRSLPEIFSFKEEIEDKLSFLDSCVLDLRQIEKQYTILIKNLQVVLEKIFEVRKKAANKFCHALKAQLIDLGFSNYLNVIIDFIPYELFPGCVEHKAQILWAPNPGQHPQLLERIASGGELSRFLLAVVSIQSSEDEGMLIFDEIDAGVGGHTLLKVADKLVSLADKKQLLVITHWPQLAVKASRHFLIIKDINENITFTRCKQLTDFEKQAELSRMAGLSLGKPD